jgi:hypothetical protein
MDAIQIIVRYNHPHQVPVFQLEFTHEGAGNKLIRSNQDDIITLRPQYPNVYIFRVKKKKCDYSSNIYKMLEYFRNVS